MPSDALAGSEGREALDSILAEPLKGRVPKTARGALERSGPMYRVPRGRSQAPRVWPCG